MKSYFLLLAFELKTRLFRLSALVYTALFAFIAFMIAIAFAGAFKGASVSFGLSNKLALNSPLTLNMLTTFLGYLGLLVSAPIFGQSINKDFESKLNQILFTTPLKKFTYFSVRYLGSLISSTVILLSIALGIWIATFMPFVDRSLIAENHLWFYLAPYLTNVIPNLIIFGGVFIAVVSLAKKMAPVYVASIAVFTGWMIASNLTSDLENKWLAAMIEPFGLEATSNITRYWSIAEQSSRVVPLTGVLLTNRLLWGGVGLLFAALAYWIFNPYNLGREKKKTSELAQTAHPVELPETRLIPGSLLVFLSLTAFEVKQAFKNIYFLMILLCGILFLGVVASQSGKFYGTEIYPVTYYVLDIMGDNFALFIVILITYYAGELVWRDRDLQVYEMVDAKPVSNRFLYFSKLTTLFSLQIFLSLVVLACCVLFQTFKGYTHYEWGVYFQHLALYELPGKLLLCVLALFVHNLVPNKYVGHSAMVLFFLLSAWLPSYGFDHFIYRVGRLPYAQYSDMNGFGTSAYKFTVLLIYWSFFYFGLALITLLFWRRGAVIAFKDRWRELRDRWRPFYKFGFAGSATGFLLMGGFVFYNTNILNPYYTKAELEQKNVDFELKYSHFFRESHLDLVAVDIHADIFPETQSLREFGTYTLRNRRKEPIDTLFLRIDLRSDIKQMNFDVPFTVAEHDARLGTWVYHFTSPIQPNQELHLKFDVFVNPKGFTNDEFNKIVLNNGTFIHNGDFTPAINYDRDYELEDDKTRRKYGLKDRPRLFDVGDAYASLQNSLSNEGTWIKFQATVSTSPDQIAVAPGYLDKEWTENGRRFFHYVMDTPILDFYAILSARYEVLEDEWNGVKIQVFHHPGHTWDLQRMVSSVKKGLEYYSANFSPYQFRQFRIFEFPRYKMYAQSFPNTIPYSEGIGFIARVNDKDPESIDYPFYVTSHELAHQWWGHQVMGGPVQGETMLTESLAQYSAFMVQEHEYGPKQMKKFFKYELDHYLAGRAHEQKKEMPLALNENQQYIHYQKGGLVFYALKDYFGEVWVNGILKNFLKDYAFHEGPFPRAIDLVDRFRKAAPDDKKYIIDDLFTTVTLYNNRADSADVVKVGDRYQVMVKAFVQKLRADELGNESEVPMNDWVDIGVYGKDDELLYLEKHQLKSGPNEIQVMVDKLPVKAGVDPLNKLIDRVSDDNTVKCSQPKGVQSK